MSGDPNTLISLFFKAEVRTLFPPKKNSLGMVFRHVSLVLVIRSTTSEGLRFALERVCRLHLSVNETEEVLAY